MRKSIAILAFVGVCVSAQAAINFNLDIPDQIVGVPNAPTSVVFTGTVDVTAGWDVTAASLDFPFLINTTTGLGTTFDPGFLAYLGTSAPGVDYSGAIFSVTVLPTTAPGTYGYFFNSVNPSLASVFASNGVSSFNDTEAYSLTVQAVPEPATMAVLGLGAAALIRRRRR